MNDTTESRFLVEAVLHDLAEDAEALLVLAHALDGRAAAITSDARPQQLRETAALIKSAALQLGQAAANLVGSSERLRLVAEFHDLTDDSGGELPS